MGVARGHRSCGLTNMGDTMLNISLEHITPTIIISNTFWYIKFEYIFSKYEAQTDYIIKTFIWAPLILTQGSRGLTL